MKLIWKIVIQIIQAALAIVINNNPDKDKELMP